MAGDDAPAASVPVHEPVSVRTTVEPLSRVSVTPWAPPAEAADPWFLSVTEKVTVLPAVGVPGDQLTTEATRSELLTGVTVKEDVYELLASLDSMTVFASSTLATTWYEPASRAPMVAETVVCAPAARAP